MIHFKNGIFINNVLIAPATITNVSSDKALLEGSDLQLFCIASGRPTPNITWVKITSSGGESDVLHRGTTWDFKNISRTDDGTYRCTARNGVGNPASHTLQVNVECKYMICTFTRTYNFKHVASSACVHVCLYM